METPQKILIVKDLTFILPKDFEGNLSDALLEYIKYRNENIKDVKVTDTENKYNCTEIVLMGKDGIKSCVLYGIVEISDGKYRVIESSSSDIIVKWILVIYD